MGLHKESASRMVVSPSQALLILIEQEKSLSKLVELKKLYLLGVVDELSQKKMNKWLRDYRLKDYDVRCDDNTITRDPTRRYFETHLAYHIREDILRSDELPIEVLEVHFDIIMQTYFPKKDPKMEAVFTLPLNLNQFTEPMMKEYHSNYSQMLKIYDEQLAGKLKEEERKALTQEKEKSILLLKISFFSVMVAFLTEKTAHPMPINIYSVGVFSKSVRGVIKKETDQIQLQGLSNNLGNLQSVMPLPRNDLAYTEHSSAVRKPVDQAGFDAQASWVRSNFATMVNPQVNSISGTLLAVLRVLKDLDANQQLIFNTPDSMFIYLKSLTVVLLFNSSGHSFHEFLAVLQLPDIQKAFPEIIGKNAMMFKEEYMLMTTSPQAFDAALHETIEYNHTILNRSALQAEFQAKRFK